MKKYDHKRIESKWQKEWEDSGLNKTKGASLKPKCYVLDMFPYPSGEGLHVGHPKGYIATDIYSRYKRMRGYNILHPMGWDAFGLPAENFAIKNKVHPRIAVEKNIARFKDQLSKIGFNYDWEREINTTDPEYYKWTQWIFLQMWKHGLAYQSFEPINWCPSCLTGLANEDLEDDRCDRCGSAVEQKPMRQWMLKITDYAERLLENLEDLDWPESIKESQRNWIGKSEGAEIDFQLKESEAKISVFTTRPDTLFGATYMVLAPEHELVDELKEQIENWDEVFQYTGIVKNKSDIERTAEGKNKTGVELKGVKAINPATKEEIPLFIADYVLAHYGTGAIMAVPASDSRDFGFAREFDLPIIEVIVGGDIKKEAFVGAGKLINSGKFDGMDSEEAKQKITEFVGGKMTTTYKLRDWVFSRQRYWGEPIPIIHCEKCGIVPVPESDLPVTLPEVESYEPTGTGESPLAAISEWVNVKCPKCGGPAKRETNTMPQWAGSSWYYLRYIDPKNDKALVDKEKEKYWSPVDMYVGGAEHATRHLIYARFWHKFLYDIGTVNYKEPFEHLQSVGLILAQDGRKMSKRYGNVVNPDEAVERFGADALRVYEMFMGPFDQSTVWSTDNMVGSYRFLEKVWLLISKISARGGTPPEDGQAASGGKNKKIELLTHKTIKKVGEDIESFDFNTAISSMMVLVNGMGKEEIAEDQFEILLKLLAPFAPHIAEELWHELGNKDSIHLEPWPKYDAEKIKEDTVTIAVQVNGRTRGTFEVAAGASEDEVKNQALSQENVKKWREGKETKKIIYIKGRLVNIVVS
ncbi:MAG: leucine--tRNA ligase [Patescibacteria group bacterium]|nr:MAG: leucine--tRNA ligase [Patescibacteria group bacterium]